MHRIVFAQFHWVPSNVVSDQPRRQTLRSQTMQLQAELARARRDLRSLVSRELGMGTMPSEPEQLEREQLKPTLLLPSRDRSKEDSCLRMMKGPIWLAPAAFVAGELFCLCRLE